MNNNERAMHRLSNIEFAVEMHDICAVAPRKSCWFKCNCSDDDGLTPHKRIEIHKYYGITRQSRRGHGEYEGSKTQNGMMTSTGIKKGTTY